MMTIDLRIPTVSYNLLSANNLVTKLICLQRFTAVDAVLFNLDDY